MTLFRHKNAQRLTLSLVLLLGLTLSYLAPVTTIQAAPIGQDAPTEPVSPAAVGKTYNVTSTKCTGPDSITEAIAKANASSNEDTIELSPGLQIDATTCPFIDNIHPENYVVAEITESLIVKGNNGALTGNMYWNNKSGVQSFAGCPYKEYFILGTMPGFLRIGKTHQDNQDLRVTIKDLRVQTFRQVAQVRKNASLELDNVYMKDIYFWRWCFEPAIDAYEGADVTLRRSTLENYISFNYSYFWK